MRGAVDRLLHPEPARRRRSPSPAGSRRAVGRCPPSRARAAAARPRRNDDGAIIDVSRSPGPAPVPGPPRRACCSGGCRFPGRRRRCRAEREESETASPRASTAPRCGSSRRAACETTAGASGRAGASLASAIARATRPRSPSAASPTATRTPLDGGDRPELAAPVGVAQRPALDDRSGESSSVAAARERRSARASSPGRGVRPLGGQLVERLRELRHREALAGRAPARPVERVAFGRVAKQRVEDPVEIGLRLVEDDAFAREPAAGASSSAHGIVPQRRALPRARARRPGPRRTPGPSRKTCYESPSKSTDDLDAAPPCAGPRRDGDEEVEQPRRSVLARARGGSRRRPGPVSGLSQTHEATPPRRRRRRRSRRRARTCARLRGERMARRDRATHSSERTLAALLDESSIVEERFSSPPRPPTSNFFFFFFFFFYSPRAAGLARPAGHRLRGARLPAGALPPARLHALGRLLVRRPLQLRRLQRPLLPARGAARDPLLAVATVALAAFGFAVVRGREWGRPRAGRAAASRSCGPAS